MKLSLGPVPLPQYMDRCERCLDAYNGRIPWGRCYCTPAQHAAAQRAELHDHYLYVTGPDAPRGIALWRCLWSWAPPRNSYELLLLVAEFCDLAADGRRVRRALYG